VSVIGVLGVGHIAADLVVGLLRAGTPPGALLLSPRGRETAQALHAAHGIPIAADNAALVAASETVLLCVRPAAALATVAGLPWRRGHLLLSVAAGVARAALAEAAAPAEVVRAMPISAARLGASPTTLHPDAPRARALLERVGPVLPIADEAAFERATISAAMYGWVFALLGESAAWLETAGLDPAQARALSTGTFAAAAAVIGGDDRPVAQRLVELATPGGITQAGLDALAHADAWSAWRGAFDAAVTRLGIVGQPRVRSEAGPVEAG
jgi:pyrroline-5-carboxylate reductase